jgi:uncharacterized protein YggE
MRLRLIVFLVIGLLILAQSSYSQDIEENELTVYGKVRVFAKTDRANIPFVIRGFGKSLEEALGRANAKIDSVTEKLYALGLTEKNLSTSFFQSRENYGDKAFLSSKKDYRVTMNASITTDSLHLLEAIVIILSESNVERIDNVTFELINYSQLKKDALQKAVSQAKEKAEMMTQQLGVGCGDVIEIEEIRIDEPKIPSHSRNYSDTFNEAYLFGHLAVADEIFTSPGFFAQEITFDSEVKVVFKILNKSNSPEIEEEI